ncbi:GNAT family N-acetyltransferase [Chromobacterium subtsugae]|uniref:GNAT family N-acetyltransferase n=1 Tax=Chromobacterium subtsugae TaxID=251747 RepID=A0ABS7FJM7_9NEIS|nr:MULTISPECIES: GNAT family N-acetyltransferase [Chromobacterium]KUM04437.1 acetyltransferase [Chromobacterium subtsugae]KZE84826.1 acetyltransferase [Chromobacterium sp. F49]MBW7568907.1 GNAT family N-acetyltransferase [Chromobacterium subtsugae]MBW8290262.1 GNAT family N-acetyltransferase [Chromobacterium subtsugae]WSE92084.1 GNAT family N-acetyltransferase [Chromobacterium subtsugae]
MAAELNFASLAQGPTLRPAQSADAPFIDKVYRSARPDLQWIQGERELIDTVQRQQLQALLQGAGQNHPNAMHFVVEQTGAAIGVVMVDFGHNEVRVIFLAMLPETRGRGYGKQVLQGLQQAARQVRCPLAVVVWHGNEQARRLYQSLGFVLEEAGAVADKLVWYPDGRSIMVGAV